MHMKIEMMDKNLKGKEREVSCTCVCIIRYLIMRTILKNSGRTTASYSPFPSPNILIHYHRLARAVLKL